MEFWAISLNFCWYSVSCSTAFSSIELKMSQISADWKRKQELLIRRPFRKRTDLDVIEEQFGSPALEGVDAGSGGAASAALEAEQVGIETVTPQRAQRPAHRTLAALVQDQVRVAHFQLTGTQPSTRIVHVHHLFSIASEKQLSLFDSSLSNLSVYCIIFIRVLLTFFTCNDLYFRPPPIFLGIFRINSTIGLFFRL